MDAEALDVTNKQFLEASEQVRLLRLPNHVYYFDLKTELADRVELAQHCLDCKLEHRKANIFANLSHRLHFLVQSCLFV